jgi:AcrR family transcriptional regulator
MTVAAHADGRRGGAGRGLPGASLTPREKELLAVTLQVLSETGYDKLTVDQVVARAHASKTTVYRRWPTKADLVRAAFAHRTHGEFAIPLDTGTLRGDLLALAEMIARVAGEYGRVIAGILAAGERSPRLRELLAKDLYDQRRDQVQGVLRRAATRGEIAHEAISDDLWDVLPAYILFRTLLDERPVPPATLRALIDDVLLPSLTRLRPP